MACKFFNLDGRVFRAVVEYKREDTGNTVYTSVHGPYTRQGDATRQLTPECARLVRWNGRGHNSDVTIISAHVQVGTVEWADVAPKGGEASE